MTTEDSDDDTIALGDLILAMLHACAGPAHRVVGAILVGMDVEVTELDVRLAALNAGVVAREQDGVEWWFAPSS